MQRPRQIQAFFDDGDDDVDRDEEELDLPPTSIQIGDAQCGQAELVGQEYELLAGLRIDVRDAP